MAAASSTEKERCLVLMERFKNEVVAANAPNAAGMSTIASALWANAWLQALDTLGEIDGNQ